MDQAPLISAIDISTLTPLRLLYVPSGEERPDALICVPIEAWIDVAKRSQTGFDDLVFWQREIYVELILP